MLFADSTHETFANVLAFTSGEQTFYPLLKVYVCKREMSETAGSHSLVSP